MKFGIRFYDGLRIYLTKILKNPSRGIFYLVFKYLAILATQNHDKIHIVYNSEFSSYPIQNVLYNFYLKGESKW